MLLAVMAFFLSGLMTVTTDHAEAQDDTTCSEGIQSGGLCIIEGDQRGLGCPFGSIVEIDGDCFFVFRKRRQSPTCSGSYTMTINDRCVFVPPTASDPDFVCPASPNGWPVRAELTTTDGVDAPALCIEDELPPFLPCPASSTPDPDGVSCLDPTDKSSVYGCDAGFTFRLGRRCFHIEPAPGVNLTCAQGILEIDGCRVDAGFPVNAPSTCPEGGAVLYVDGVCFVHRDAIAGACNVGQIIDPNDASLCRLPVDLRPGDRSCPDGFRIASFNRNQCTRFDRPLGEPDLSCTAEAAASAGCIYQVVHQQIPAQAQLIADQATTLSYFSCEGSTRTTYVIRSFDDDVLTQGSFREGPAGIYSTTYTAPAGYYEVEVRSECPDGFFYRVADVQFVDPGAPVVVAPEAVSTALPYEGPFTAVPTEQPAAYGFGASPVAAEPPASEPAGSDTADPSSSAPALAFTGTEHVLLTMLGAAFVSTGGACLRISRRRQSNSSAH